MVCNSQRNVSGADYVLYQDDYEVSSGNPTCIQSLNIAPLVREVLLRKGKRFVDQSTVNADFACMLVLPPLSSPQYFVGYLNDERDLSQVGKVVTIGASKGRRVVVIRTEPWDSQRGKVSDV
jgi:hypothetical protein